MRSFSDEPAPPAQYPSPREGIFYRNPQSRTFRLPATPSQPQKLRSRALPPPPCRFPSTPFFSHTDHCHPTFQAAPALRGASPTEKNGSSKPIPPPEAALSLERRRAWPCGQQQTPTQALPPQTCDYILPTSPPPHGLLPRATRAGIRRGPTCPPPYRPFFTCTLHMAPAKSPAPLAPPNRLTLAFRIASHEPPLTPNKKAPSRFRKRAPSTEKFHIPRKGRDHPKPLPQKFLRVFRGLFSKSPLNGVWGKAPKERTFAPNRYKTLISTETLSRMRSAKGRTSSRSRKSSRE